MIKIDLKDIWDNKKKDLIRAAIFLFAIILANKAIYKPQTKKIDLLKTQLEEEAEKNRLADEINDLENRINLYRQRTFAQRDLSQIINKIFEIAKDTGTEVVSLQPQQIEKENIYVRLPLTVTIWAGYHQLGKFLSHIESSEKFIKVDTLQIEVVESSMTEFSVSEGKEKPRVTLVVSGIYLK